MNELTAEEWRWLKEATGEDQPHLRKLSKIDSLTATQWDRVREWITWRLEKTPGLMASCPSIRAAAYLAKFDDVKTVITRILEGCQSFTKFWNNRHKETHK